MPPIDELSPEELTQFARLVLPVRVKEKHCMGEVFTPPPLIHQMLDTMPNSVWKNPNAKWLDPSCGVGNFFIFVYLRLMNGLSQWQPNKIKRQQHIVKNMLYMAELNRENYDICRRLFGKYANIWCGDFLSNSMPYRDTVFHYVVGNPPFQKDLSDKGRGIKLYNQIFLKAFGLLQHNGLLLFVVPDNMFSGMSNPGYKELVSHWVKFVSFNGVENYFTGIKQEMCYFLAQKTETETETETKRTKIENQNGDVIYTILTQRHLNPVRNWTPQTERLVNKYVLCRRNNAKYNRGQALSNYIGEKYPLIYTFNKNLHTNDLKMAVGFGVPKIVIFTISPNFEFKVDWDGTYGVGPNTIYIPFLKKKHGKSLETFFNSSDYKLLAQSTRTTRQYIKLALIEYLNIPLIIGNTNNTNKTKKRKNNE